MRLRQGVPVHAVAHHARAERKSTRDRGAIKGDPRRIRYPCHEHHPVTCEYSPDQQLLRKIVGRFVTIKMNAGAQKTAQTSKEPSEMDGPNLPFLYQG
jgi:hypothetical protein